MSEQISSSPSFIQHENEDSSSNAALQPPEIQEILDTENRIQRAFRLLNEDLEDTQQRADRLTQANKNEGKMYGVKVLPTFNRGEYGIKVDKYEIILVENKT